MSFEFRKQISILCVILDNSYNQLQTRNQYINNRHKNSRHIILQKKKRHFIILAEKITLQPFSGFLEWNYRNYSQTKAICKSNFSCLGNNFRDDKKKHFASFWAPFIEGQYPHINVFVYQVPLGLMTSGLKLETDQVYKFIGPFISPNNHPSQQNLCISWLGNDP